MITRSRLAALNSTVSPKPASSNELPTSTGRHNNNNNLSVDVRPGIGYGGFGLNEINYLSNNLRRSTRRPSPGIHENFTGLMQYQHLQHQQPQRLLPNGNSVDDIVKDVVGNIVDYIAKPPFKYSSHQPDNRTEHPSSLRGNSNYSEKETTEFSSDFLHCNENGLFSFDQPPSNNYFSGDDGNEFGEENGGSGIEAITCEVSLDVDIPQDDFGRCPVCVLYGRLSFEGHLGDRLGKVCSKRCADKLRVDGKACLCVSCDKRIAPDSQGYYANFGLERSTLCSEECLLKFEKENEPSQRCYSCKKEIHPKEDSDSCIFYWQTMEFCSPECIENLQQFWGKKCANCDSQVPQQSLGKYSVRFGNVIKQFCHGSCLEQYKKAVKVCAYCQVNLSGCLGTCTSVTGGSSTKRIREFCDPVCRSHYLQMVSNRNNSNSNNSNGESNSILAVQCCQCSRIVEKSSCLDVIFKGRKFLICSTFCLSAFRFSFDVTDLICESCSKHDWSCESANILHYSGFTKLFCSRKCLQMHVLKIRRIQSCLSCNVKKYNFDLVEKYDMISGDSKLFCSTYCYSTFELFESQNKDKETKSLCEWCRKLSSLPFRIPSPEKALRNFCTYACVLAYQQHELSTGQLGLESNSPATQPLPPPPPSQSQSNSIIKNVNPTIDSTPKQSMSTSGSSYRESTSESKSVTDSVRSSKFSTSLMAPQVPSLAVKPSVTFRSSPFPSSPYNSSISTTISDFQRSYTTRSKTSSNSVTSASSSSQQQTPSTRDHRDTPSTRPFFNNQRAQRDQRFSASDSLLTTRSTGSSTDTKKTGNSKNLGLSSPYILDPSANVGGVADKSTMWQPSRRSKATLCRPIKKDRHTQTDASQTTTEPSTSEETSEKEEKPVKFVPIPIFVPIFIPMPIPVPLGSASLFPLPLPTPIPFGFPIDSRKVITDLNESTDEECSTSESQVQPKESRQKKCPKTSTAEETNKTPKNTKETDRKKPKSANKLPTSEPINSPQLSNESKSVRSVRLKRNVQNYCDDSDSSSSSSSSDDREKTKRRRVTISTHG